RDYGFVTPVKDQGNTGNCWAFATMAALESHLLKTENTSYNLSQKWDFSENNLKNVMSSLGRNGTDKLVDGGGNMLMALAYLLRWSGPINESDDPYGSNYTGISEDVYPIKHVQGVKFLPPRQNYLDNDFIKEAILENGAAFVSMHWNQSYVNGNSYYYFNEGSQNNTYDHAVTIVGWDDNYSKYNFKNQTPGMGNGAFIIKNSWGTNSGDNGYYYVSYYDQIFCLKNNQYAGFVFTNVENVTNYDYNYNYNPLGLTGFLSVSSTTMNFANQWTALKNVTLKSFGLYVNYSSVCIANLIVNGLSICNTTTYLPYPGFHTVQFNQSANVNEGQTFRVEISLSNYETSGISLVPLESRVVNYSNVVSDFNQSFLWLYRNGVYQWVDLKNEVDNANICLHVYTECIEGLLETHVRSNNLITGFNSSSLNATLVDSSGNPLSNKNIIYEVNNVQYTRTTDSNGKASLAIRLNPGSYKFLISFLGDDTYHKSNRLVDVNVSKMHTNINQNVSTVHKGEYLGLTLKDSNGKALSGKRVAFCIINATYNRTTDTNGKAKLLIRLSPGTYSVTLRFNGTTGYYACNKTFNLKVLAAKSNPNPINDENYDESNIDNNIIMDNDAHLESSYELIDNNTYKYIKSNNITDKDDIIKNNSNKNLLKISLENNDKMVYDNLNSDYPDNEKTESYSVNYTNNENHYIKDSLTEIRSSFINNPNLDSDDFIQIKIGGEYG
ncbi:MAG: hypothetical protein IKV87_01085, partial [Methanobrevibacter sp.]|nr:hypothetical protein [Methanobrevibacter sp.]